MRQFSTLRETLTNTIAVIGAKQTLTELWKSRCTRPRFIDSWAAVGEPGIIGPIFIEGNVNGEAYLKLLQDDFYHEFSSLPNQSELMFM